MTPKRLAEIEARAEAATPGPWELWVHAASPNKPSCIYGDGCESVICVREPGDEQAYLVISKNDEKFILNARQDIPDLIAEVKRLRKELDDDKWTTYNTVNEQGETICVEKVWRKNKTHAFTIHAELMEDNQG